MVGPQLRYGDGVWQNSRRRFARRLTGFVESTWLGRHPVVARTVAWYYMLDWPASFSHDVDWLVGAAMLARRDALEAVRMPAYVGPFDEGFFMYSEEVDLCAHRRKRACWRIRCVPAGALVHYEGRSEQVVVVREIRCNRSQVRYYQKDFGLRWSRRCTDTSCWSVAAACGWSVANGWLSHKRPFARPAFRTIVKCWPADCSLAALGRRSGMTARSCRKLAACRRQKSAADPVLPQQLLQLIGRRHRQATGVVLADVRCRLAHPPCLRPSAPGAEDFLVGCFSAGDDVCGR